MNLKTKYHYSYFVYPFVVKDGRYKDFIDKVLGDQKNWKFIIMKKLDDVETYAYFLPYVKKFLFPTLYWSENFKAKYEKMSYKKKLDILSKHTCVNFEYIIEGNNTKSYNLNNTAMSFKIKNIKLICFEQGICFLIFKTELDKDEIYSDDILDFNYKFRTINPRYQKKKKSEGMRVTNKEFGEVEDLSSFIYKLLYGYEDVEEENVYFDRLFTYSYMCLDDAEWNENNKFLRIINEFYKFQYVLPGSFDSSFDSKFSEIKLNTYKRWKYSIYGFSREAGVVLASSREKFNIEKLPNYYEKMYFNIFLLAFYQRISLILFSEELMNNGNKNVEALKKKFTKFTHFSWFSQITNSEQGMDIWKKWQKAFDLPQLFDEVQKEYSEFYDYTVARGQEKINILLIIIYTISLIFTDITVLADFKIISSNNRYARMLLIGMIAITIITYPTYLLIKIIRKCKKHKKNKDFIC